MNNFKNLLIAILTGLLALSLFSQPLLRIFNPPSAAACEVWQTLLIEADDSYTEAIKRSEDYTQFNGERARELSARYAQQQFALKVIYAEEAQKIGCRLPLKQR
jgi:hypothetical protein